MTKRSASGELLASQKTKREEYASLIIAGMCSNSQLSKTFGNNAATIADAAVKMADALIARLEQP